MLNDSIVLHYGPLSFCLQFRHLGGLGTGRIRSAEKVLATRLQLCSRQIARLSTPAKATHAANGKRHHAAILSSQNVPERLPSGCHVPILPRAGGAGCWRP